MTLTNASTLGELFKKAATENGTTIEPNNWDVTLKELQSELDVVLKNAFDAWYENRIMHINCCRGIARARFITPKDN